MHAFAVILIRNNVINKPIDQWFYFFKNSDLPKNYNAKGLKEVNEKLNFEKMSPLLKQQFIKHKENLLISLGQLEMANLDGFIKGEVKGEIKGGIRGEIKEKRQTVINGFSNGLEINMISNITQLSEEEVIKTLKEEGLMK